MSDEPGFRRTAGKIVGQSVGNVAADAIGFFGGDYLTELRARNRARFHKRTREILAERNTTNPTIDDANVKPVLLIEHEAQDEARASYKNFGHG